MVSWIMGLSFLSGKYNGNLLYNKTMYNEVNPNSGT